MLPPNFLTIPQIQHERPTGSKLVRLTVLLEFLLKPYNVDAEAAKGENREPKVGERVLADKQLFNDFTRVLWALKVRNSFVPVTGNEFGKRDQRNAVDCLIEAIGEVGCNKAMRNPCAFGYCENELCPGKNRCSACKKRFVPRRNHLVRCKT